VHTDDPFYPPMTYSPGWQALGVLLLFGVVAWALFVWWHTRVPRPRPPAAPVGPSPGWLLARAKHQTIDQIERIAWEAEHGRIDARSAHQQISAAVRSFVDDLGGTRSRHMTLSELGAGGPRLAHVTHVVHQLYPGEFGPDPARPVRPSAEAAKAVVAGWC
jgi:hypothetical protein